jgi:hypothetical protein
MHDFEEDGGTFLIDGASDYIPSDEGEGPEDDERTNGQKPNLVEKLRERAQKMLRSNDRGQYFGLDQYTQYWVVLLYRYNLDKSRWVKKGPVIMYFVDADKPRLMGNFLYGTKSSAFDIQCIIY